MGVCEAASSHDRGMPTRIVQSHHPGSRTNGQCPGGHQTTRCSRPMVRRAEHVVHGAPAAAQGDPHGIDRSSSNHERCRSYRHRGGIRGACEHSRRRTATHEWYPCRHRVGRSGRRCDGAHQWLLRIAEHTPGLAKTLTAGFAAEQAATGRVQAHQGEHRPGWGGAVPRAGDHRGSDGDRARASGRNQTAGSTSCCHRPGLRGLGNDRERGGARRLGRGRPFVGHGCPSLEHDGDGAASGSTAVAGIVGTLAVGAGAMGLARAVPSIAHVMTNGSKLERFGARRRSTGLAFGATIGALAGSEALGTATGGRS